MDYLILIGIVSLLFGIHYLVIHVTGKSIYDHICESDFDIDEDDE